MKIAIFAVDEKFNFGNEDGSLPWKKPIKEDMEWFKANTKDTGAVVMGVATFRSLPRKLVGRKNIVVGRIGSKIADIKAKDGSTPDLLLQYNSNLPFEGIDKKLLAAGIENYAVIGGANLLVKAIESHMMDKILMTVIEGEYASDIKFKAPDTKLIARKVFSCQSEVGKLLFYDFGYKEVVSGL